MSTRGTFSPNMAATFGRASIWSSVYLIDIIYAATRHSNPMHTYTGDCVAHTCIDPAGRAFRDICAHTHACTHDINFILLREHRQVSCTHHILSEPASRSPWIFHIIARCIPACIAKFSPGGAKPKIYENLPFFFWLSGIASISVLINA